MKNMAFKMWCKAQYVKQHAGDYLKREEGGVDGIIIAVIIVIIVVALGVVFRDQIGIWFNKLVEDGNNQISGAGSMPYTTKGL